ncbi:M-phase-specific PLK1-interacting protein isoform X2 [Notolabrus celidotus]|uniref:M-phase-specific PLK1-interacting protein isoform X2 n=1 Tax=Notolabrus celidotus TaxID=1203425 RepID=UPI0014908522|nr:M-phase-specific PLK1-interacting protein isoform X2 [Notolabrus celidotus]
MDRAPVRPSGRFRSPSSCWGFPGTPHGGSGPPRSGSPRGGSPYSPVYSPTSVRGYRDGSPARFGSGSRGSGGGMWRRGSGFRRYQSFSPSAQHNQSGSSDAPVEKYFSPSMMQDPWAALQPVAVADSWTP